jgi:hypothetical protein
MNKEARASLLKQLETAGARAELADDMTGIRQVIPVTVPAALLDQLAALLSEQPSRRGRPTHAVNLVAVAGSCADAVSAGMRLPEILALASEQLSLEPRQTKNLRIMTHGELRRRGLEKPEQRHKRGIRRRGTAGFMDPQK